MKYRIRNAPKTSPFELLCFVSRYHTLEFGKFSEILVGIFFPATFENVKNVPQTCTSNTY